MDADVQDKTYVEVTNFRRQLRRYLADEDQAYKTYLAEHPDAAHSLRHLTFWLRRTRKVAIWLNENNKPIPQIFLTPYTISVAERLSSKIPVKYQLRGLNTLRELARFHIFLPELTQPDAPKYKILDPSSGGCGTAEVARYLGHDIDNFDFFSTDKDIYGTAYASIHNTLNLSVGHFDGQNRPYPFDDNSYDYILCNQALDAYAPPEQWVTAVDELTRIARRGVQIIFNPVAKRLNPDGIDHIQNCIDALSAKYDLREAVCFETAKRGIVITL